jgi:hypothetical protein
MRTLVLALVSVAVMGQAALGQGTENAWVKAPPAVLQKATTDTIEVPLNVLDGLTVSEPNIVVPEGAPKVGGAALKMLVSKTGTVEEAVASSGDATLRKAAEDGVMSWKYRPYVVNGEPREFQVTILIQFREGVSRRVTAPPSGPMPNLGPLLQKAMADTIAVPPNVLQGLATSEPEIIAPEGVPQAGLVSMKLLVSKTGDVEEIVVLQGESALRPVAAHGVMGWKYRPYLVNGDPQKFQSSILIRFVAGVGTRVPVPPTGMAGVGIGTGETKGATPPTTAPNP